MRESQQMDMKSVVALFIAFIVHKLLESYAEKAYFPYPIKILFLNLCGSSISHLFVLIFV